MALTLTLTRWSTALATLLVSASQSAFNILFYAAQTYLIMGWQASPHTSPIPPLYLPYISPVSPGLITEWQTRLYSVLLHVYHRFLPLLSP